MQTIVLVMRRKPVVQALMKKMQDDSETHLMIETDYTHADATIRSHGACIALLEVAETGEYDMSHCLALCIGLRKEAPQCKLLLICPEQDTGGVAQAVESKREGRIDDFVFYDSTTDYLVSKLSSFQS